MEKNIAGFLLEKTKQNPDKKLFIFLQDDLSQPFELTYNQLAEKVKKLASFFNNNIHSENALLLYADHVDFIISFLACQLAGIIAIPMYPPRGSRHMDRLLKIIDDASVDTILTSDSYSEKIRRSVGDKINEQKINVIVTDKLTTTLNEKSFFSDNSEQNISFIQYTSGSTGDPKGVIITHKNLLHNQQLIKNTFGCDESSIICSWLPFYHDMGLIGNILHTIYAGCTCILMSPFHFMQKPQRWLEAITKYKATHSGGPNFAYELCVNEIKEGELKNLDLSSWKVAYNGSEQVRPETIDRFVAYFTKTGFKEESFYPCYGLAEATLLVSGVKINNNYKVIHVDSDQLKVGNLRLINEESPSSKKIMSSGIIAEGMSAKILNQETFTECSEFEAGEICIAGDSVCSEYFGRNSHSQILTNDPFRNYFKTGDLGFIYQDHLFVIGRIKEMLIIRGKNYYPYDIEFSACSAHEAIESNGAAAFCFNSDKSEELVLFVEIKRKYLQLVSYADVLKNIETRLIEEIGIRPFDIVLVNHLTIPRTSSGKIQRFKCALNYSEKVCNPLSSLLGITSDKENVRSDEYDYLKQCVKENNNRADLLKYLQQVFILKMPNAPISLNDSNLELTAIGVDSLRAIEIINTINKDLQINLDSTKIYQTNTISGLISSIETTLWLSNKETTGQEIIV